MADDEPPVDGTVNAILRYRHLPPIPTRFDRKLGDLDDLNGVVMTKLRTIRHAGDACDLGGLRELLQTYVDAVMALAKDVGR
jgi:hypothetical protein